MKCTSNEHIQYKSSMLLKNDRPVWMSSNIKHKYKVDFERTCSLCIVKYQELRRIRWNFRRWSWTNSMMQCCCHLGVISRFYMEPSWPTILLMTGAGVGSVIKVVFWSSNRKLGLWSKQQMATVTQYRNSRLWHAMDFTAHKQKIRTN